MLVFLVTDGLSAYASNCCLSEDCVQLIAAQARHVPQSQYFGWYGLAFEKDSATDYGFLNHNVQDAFWINRQEVLRKNDHISQFAWL